MLERRRKNFCSSIGNLILVNSNFLTFLGKHWRTLTDTDKH